MTVHCRDTGQPPTPPSAHLRPRQPLRRRTDDTKVSFVSCARASVPAILRVNRGWTRRCGDAGAATPYACPRVPTDDRPPPAADEGRPEGCATGRAWSARPAAPISQDTAGRPGPPRVPSSIPPPHERSVTTRAWWPHRRRPVLSPRAGAFRVTRSPAGATGAYRCFPRPQRPLAVTSAPRTTRGAPIEGL